MPTLTSSDRLTPKSTLRHRPIGSDVLSEEPPRVPRASRTQTQQPAVKTTTPEIPAWKSPTRLRPRRQRHVPLVGIGIGMVIAVMVVWLGQLLVGWIGNGWNELHYGMPRTLPVTLLFVDSRHDHQPDMVVLFQSERMVFRNGQGAFHAPPVNS
jgi:hypothetical protein